jgi:DGQHR domain-containing protein
MLKMTLETFEAPQQNKYTEPLLFVPGEYRLSQVGRVPYLVAVMSLQDLVDQIKLVEDLPEEARLDWSLEELFQRDISWDRVQKELVEGYLKDSNKLSFFNSLTIALLPQKGLEIEECYGQPESSPTAAYPDWEKIDVGNICVEYISDRSIGVVRWHKERVFPVAIDGQHRLAALKKYCEEGKDHLGLGVALDTKIPLIFLILDERVGFEGRSENLLVTLREIFIDLNKNARKVPKSRLILLEDLDIQSLCVRTLLASKAKETSSDVLPLSLVVWREDEAKFDAESRFSHAITSVLNLNEIVGSCLGVNRPFEEIDRLDDSQVRRYVTQLNAKLKLDKEVEASIEEHLQLCINRQDPFSFDDEHLTAFRQAFREQWTPHIIRVIREFTPYRKYLSEAEQMGAIDGMLADYLLLPEEKRERFEEKKKAEDETFDPRSEINDRLEKLKALKKNEWAFYVVFQKALFINLFRLETQKESLELGEGVQSRDGFITWWMTQINALYERGVFDLNWKKDQGDLWRGIAKRPDNGAIQYSKAAANRISSFITISIWFNLASPSQDVDTFADSLMQDDSKLPNIVRTAFKGQGMVRSGLETLIGDSDELEDEELEKMVRAELLKRLKAIQE